MITFEEWLEQSEYKIIMLLDNADVILQAMKAAWDAAVYEMLRVNKNAIMRAT